MTAPIELRDRIKELRRVPGRELRANPLNFRKHPDQQRSALAGVLERIGIASALIARETPEGLELIDGHLRAEDYGDADWPVLVLDVTAEESKLLLATLDPLAALADQDSDALASLLAHLSDSDADIAKATLDDATLRGLAVGVEGLCDPDDVPEAGEPTTEPGDIWELGAHRLICGDCTDAETVARLMGNERAGLMNTDPPYGVSYANDQRPNPGVAKPRVAKPRVAKDDLTDEALQEFLEAAFTNAKEKALNIDSAWYMWHAHLTQGFFAAAAAAAAAADVLLHRQIIWVKPVLLLTRGQYHWKHEPCFMGWQRGHEPPDYGLGAGERTQTTVWEIAPVGILERREFNHATPKPVELFAIPIAKHLRAGEIAFEPFAGTGPQIIAAEQLGRRCYAIEISPAYCDIIVARWEKFTGKTARRI